MEVVIEYVMLDNFVIDGILLYCTNKLLKVPNNWWGIAGASLFGAVFALISPLLNFSGVVLLIIKMLVAFIIVLISSLTFYKLFLRIVCFVFLTFLFGGMLIAVCYFANVNVIQGANLVYFSKIPLGATVGAGVVFLMVLLKLIKKVYTAVKFSNYLTKVDLTINNKTVNLSAYYDSGNNLCTKDNVPIIILKEDSLRFWFSCDERTNILLGKFKMVKIKNPQRLEVCSVGSKAKILVFDADNLCINNRNYNVAVGIDNSKHFKDFSILLNNKMGEVIC